MGRYFNLKKLKEFNDNKRETPFTPSVPLYYALHEALQWLKEEGLENRIRRHYDCAKYLRDKLTDMDLELFVKNDKFLSNTVTAVELPENISSKQVRQYMKASYGVHVAGGFKELSEKMIRIGTIGMINREYVDRTVDAFEEALKHYR